MGERNSVMVIGGDLNIYNRLKSDLKTLGFNPLQGAYPKVNSDDIIQMSPSIIMLILTVLDNDALSACDLLTHENFVLPETALIGVVSENTMGRTLLNYKFADFIKFPYINTELGFRLQRALNLYHLESTTDTIRIGNVTVSLSTCEVKLDGRPVILTYKEFTLLKYLITHNDRVSTREVLLSDLWDDDVINGSRTVDVHIRRLRVKIGDIASSYIKTVRNVGYILRIPD